MRSTLLAKNNVVMFIRFIVEKFLLSLNVLIVLKLNKQLLVLVRMLGLIFRIAQIV